MGTSDQHNHQPEVTKRGIFDMQVCVPKSWGDGQVIEFANAANPSGVSTGWKIRKDAASLGGDPERNQCEDREEFVHVMLDA